MSSFSHKARGIHAIKLDPQLLKFSMFTTEEMKKLCITKICTSLTFDSLGNPLVGGLYDKSLGPLSEKSDSCGTCFKNTYSCPGHFGYIELPLPVVNPLFHKIVGTIIKMTCLSCFSLQIPVYIKRSLELQIKLLSCGHTTKASEIQSRLKDLVSKYESFSNVPDEELQFIKEYEDLTDDDIIKNNALKEFKGNKICLECKAPLNRIQFIRNKLILHPNKRNVDEEDSLKNKGPKSITPTESKEYMRKIWKKEQHFLKYLLPILNSVESDTPTDVFFLDILPVTPNNLRPVNFINNRIAEHPQTGLYKEIFQNCRLLLTVIHVVQQKGDTGSLPADAKSLYDLTRGKTPIEKLRSCWELLQFNVDNLLDNSNNKLNTPVAVEGLKQVIEKKEGIMRKHMMGKRVNYSARSVITPDPNLNIDEIGIPEKFAKHLTYPVPVTSWNVAELRKMVLNGPDKHPGATLIEFEDGSFVRISATNTNQKEGILKRLLTPDEKDTKAFRGVKKVHRHVCNGDVVLANRQPTLHKPSIMAHTVKILKNEKTIRMHYANCKAYNADFDGDEMNIHFPQNELARSEGYNLVHVSQQYLVPKDGTPLSGLIQDHMVSGVKMSVRGKFFNKIDYQHLVFQALSFKTSDIKLLPPAIIKPTHLWSGKQIISTIIINIVPRNKRPINLVSTAKIGVKTWEKLPSRAWKAGGTPFNNPNTMSEAEVIIQNGELLVGVLDKMHYGATPYGLIHCMYELYGGQYAIKLLSAFAKVFTTFLQTEGFTLGVHDILVLPEADKQRRKIIRKSRKIGPEVVATALDLPKDSPLEQVIEKLEEAGSRNPNMKAIIDRQYKTSIDEYTNKINKVCLPAGLLCKFPENNLQLMVQSGAKGSTVNTMQISCLLGQIELEGKRPPVMISGKSLPSFPASELAPRAGGFIDGRFMTGIKPQEFFFHCMAGREGLIDTAVKTSRSGYLQRCLIKHLEGLTVNYDLTVRDSDKSVVQFLYGEDGLDVCKSQFLKGNQIEFLANNTKTIVDKKVIKELKKSSNLSELQNQVKETEEWKEKFGNPLVKRRASRFAVFSEHVKHKLNVKKPTKIKKTTGRSKLTTAILDLWQNADDEVKKGFLNYCKPCPNPVNSDFQEDCHYGSINERMKAILDEFRLKIPIGKSRKSFEEMIKLKTMQAICPPGEPVGILAAQSIGEPSTQMTLNTFHFAGRGEMNVTLGIPRLREILMMASKNIKTPSMEIPFRKIENIEAQAENLRKKLTRVTVENVLEKVEVVAKIDVQPTRQQRYVLKFHFLPYHLYQHQYPIKPKQVIKLINSKFFGVLFHAIKKYSKVKSVLVSVEKEEKSNKSRNYESDSDNDGNTKKSDAKAPEAPEDADEDSDDEPEDTEDAKINSKYSEAHEDREPEEEEKEPEVSDDETINKSTTDVKDDEDDDETEEAGLSASDVKNSYYLVQNYQYDKKKYSWCEMAFAVPLNWKKIDLSAILKECVSKCILYETPNIKRAITYMKNDKLTLRTDGININELFKYNDLLDLNKLYCNDIHKMAETYGIEAAVKVLVQEVTDVFQVYGIKVDPRHLSLIADYMTSSGFFEPMNRSGMEKSASPLQQMSFEASLQFLKDSIIKSRADHILSPSSCLIVGKPCYTGTGIFSVMVKL